MTAAGPVSDERARERILTNLETNMLVEAGAGSGKTTALIGRMLALIERGAAIESIAAVTFTRKAANELRERFQIELEKRARNVILSEAKDLAGRTAGPSVAALPQDDKSAVRPQDDTTTYQRALDNLDRAFIGTIHSFCGRLLRERPLEVGLDPNFVELTDEEWEVARRTFWNRWMERLRLGDDPTVGELARVGVEPRTLFESFKRIVEYPDVEFPLAESGAPDVAACRRKLEALLDRAQAMMPKAEPDGGWDGVMTLVRRLRFLARIRPWSDVVAFCSAIETITESNCKVVQKRWADKTAAKALGEDFVALFSSEIADVLRCWREHRYPIVMRFIQRAAAEFERERRATGQLNFGDLLMLAAQLLRENAHARDELGSRYRHLFVDEFQDTDPVQAEVCFLLASESSEGTDWRTVRPRTGSLFLVGDPKQSIYRFRRADLEIYELVKQRMEAVVELTRNFRSGPRIGDFVNEQFGAFTPMETVRDGGSVSRYVISYEGRESPGKTYAMDAALLASWIAGRVASGERAPGDFLVLTSRKAGIAYYARALAAHNIAASTTGAQLTQEMELGELLVVLQAIADPENQVFVVAALEGLFFGLSPADLYEMGGPFVITRSAQGGPLSQLHEWWTLSQCESADVLLERILDDTGLLPYAASQELGDARAGALLHLVESVRGMSVSDAMSYVETLLTMEAPDTPLRPGRTDAVRVMNLHKAKGLEAPVVVLAGPVDEFAFEPTLYVERGEGERARGWIQLDVAQPPAWAEMAAHEADLQAAEAERLLYVAATRAKDELVVGQCLRVLAKHTADDQSRWRPLAPALATHGSLLTMSLRAAPGREVVTRTAEELKAAVDGARGQVQAAALASIEFTTVTESAKRQRQEAAAYDLGALPTGLGAAWGRAVHRSIEGILRGRTGVALREYLAAVCGDEGLGDDELGRLERLTAEMAASGAWNGFTPEVTVMQFDGTRVTEGVVDAAMLDGNGWRIVDWKSDDVGAEEWEKRQGQYEAQVGRYAEMLRALSGAAAGGTIERMRS